MHQFWRGWMGALLLLTVGGCDRGPAPPRPAARRNPAAAAGVLSGSRFHLPRTAEELAQFVPVGVSEKRILDRLGRPFLVVPADERLCTLYYVYQSPLPAEEPDQQITGFTLLMEEQKVKEAALTYRKVKKAAAPEAPPEVTLGRKWVTFKGLKRGADDYVAPAILRVPSPRPDGRSKCPCGWNWTKPRRRI